MISIKFYLIIIFCIILTIAAIALLFITIDIIRDIINRFLE